MILEVYFFSGLYIACPFIIIIIIIILLESFLGVEYLFNLWHKALASYFDTKIRRRKRSCGWPRMGVDHVRQRPSAFFWILGIIESNRANSDSAWIYWLQDFEFPLRKVEFMFFSSQLPLRVAACYEGPGPKLYDLDVIIQLCKLSSSFLVSRQDREQLCLPRLCLK